MLNSSPLAFAECPVRLTAARGNLAYSDANGCATSACDPAAALSISFRKPDGSDARALRVALGSELLDGGVKRVEH
jgi:hypothetical protein